MFFFICHFPHLWINHRKKRGNFRYFGQPKSSLKHQQVNHFFKNSLSAKTDDIFIFVSGDCLANRIKTFRARRQWIILIAGNNHVRSLRQGRRCSGIDSHVLRPIIKTLPLVISRIRFISSGCPKGMALSLPMQLFLEMAATRVIIWRSAMISSDTIHIQPIPYPCIAI